MSIFRSSKSVREIQHRLRARYNTDCARDTTQTAHEIKHRLRTRYNTVPKRLTFLKSYAPREREPEKKVPPSSTRAAVFLYLIFQ